MASIDGPLGKHRVSLLIICQSEGGSERSIESLGANAGGRDRSRNLLLLLLSSSSVRGATFLLVVPSRGLARPFANNTATKRVPVDEGAQPCPDYIIYM